MRGVLLGIVAFCSACLWETGAAQPVAGRFVTVDVYLESAEPVAAWQFEFASNSGRIVGVENGESAAFEGAPYYDREALQHGAADRLVVADFSLAEPDRLPSGRIRIATLHLMLSGEADPALDLRLVTAVTRDGRTIDASVSLETRTGSEQ